MELKYSIIIPTRNGIRYLPYALETILKQSETNFEVIVSDNHSTDGTSAYLSSLTDKRVKVVIPGHPLSMVNNFEFALNQAKGEWISVIGDDDGLQPYFFELANLLTSKYSNHEVICGKRAYYYWSGCESVYGNVALYYEGSCRIERRSTGVQLHKLLFGETAYFDEPQFYSGTIFKRSLLDKIKERQKGILFSSLTLDANSVALIFKHTRNYIYSDIPFSWIGSSPKSNGFSAANNKEIEKKSINTIADFINLNTKDSIKASDRFANLLTLMDTQCFFLEAFIESNSLYSTIYSRIVDNRLFRYMMFLKVYKSYQQSLKTGGNKQQLYLEIFEKNGINLLVLKFLNGISAGVNRVIKVSISLFKILFPGKRNEETSFILKSDNHGVYPSIIAASEEVSRQIASIQMPLWKKMI